MSKIEALIEALADACEKDGLSLVVGVAKGYELEHMNFVGHTDEMALINLVAADTICDLIDAKGCDCTGCKNAKKLLGNNSNKKSVPRKTKIDIESMMSNVSVDEILERVFGGGKRDNNQN
nr:MAG TPA: hypothetical protein [Caudoviricetes sp.]